ncbi:MULTISPECIES: Nif3-like dinuclear metal center hexameric protein [unclassified Pseudodesulfovibrio]|uniref:Nif3-like dinuclear metal center hexameric protein n=1 Tax=unclassified Pseudodesulfovibrio TaxID=2661612 RepID=UPI0013E3A5A4|nr:MULTISPECIES: Nif3-like dinuclear metal center hexameric protein [unclassified Pseudodesulfovibrio]MCJ2166073.1 Nif3-like dinuclear metal center hexameric protein [Pseudodesulfovibrio sp. S3-i]
MKIKDILSIFRKCAPEDNQSSWDNSGVQIAGTVEATDRVAVTLEPTPAALSKCLEWGAGAIITHHPLYMKPKAPDSDGMYLDVLRQVITAGAWLYSAHTSLDTRPSGPAFWLGESLGLEDKRLLEVEHGRAPVEASFYLEDPISREAADIWTNHDGVHSVSQSRTGEVRVVCDEVDWNAVADKIEFSVGRRPLFYLRSLTAPRREVGFGEVGTLPAPLTWNGFMDILGPLVKRDALLVSGPEPDKVSTVAYCGGSGSSLIDRAAKAGADVFITGDMKYHPAVETPVCVVDAGHFSLEEEMMRRFSLELQEAMPDAQVRFFEGLDPFRVHVSR